MKLIRKECTIAISWHKTRGSTLYHTDFNSNTLCGQDVSSAYWWYLTSTDTNSETQMGQAFFSIRWGNTSQSNSNLRVIRPWQYILKNQWQCTSKQHFATAPKQKCGNPVIRMNSFYSALKAALMVKQIFKLQNVVKIKIKLLFEMTSQKGLYIPHKKDFILPRNVDSRNLSGCNVI